MCMSGQPVCVCAPWEVVCVHAETCVCEGKSVI